MNKRPEKLEPGEMWVSVAEIHESDGFGPGEKTWGKLVKCRTYTAAALHGAIDWYNETDQSSECDVTFSVERHDGTSERHRIEIVFRPAARFKR